MGAGASTTKQFRSSIIAGQDLVEGSNYLFGDVQFRAIFVSFVKSGDWLEYLPQLAPEETIMGCILCKYQFATGPHVCGLDGLCGVPISPKFSTAKSTFIDLNNSVSTKKSFHQQHSVHLQDSVITVGDCNCFTPAQYMALVFGILYPLFVSMPEGDMAENTAQLFRVSRDSSASPKGSKKAVTGPSRARTVLQACSAFFEESSMMDELLKKTWVATLADTFDKFPVGLTISNTGRAGSPFVYCNAAFETLCGYSRQEIANNNMDFLNGEVTEEPQIKLIQEAMRHAHPVDVAITHYNKRKKPYVCLVSLKPSGNYSIAAHFPVTKGMRSEDLKVRVYS